MKGLREVLERKIVDAHDERTRAKRRRRELHVQNINRVLAEFSAEYERNANKRGMRPSRAD